MRRSHKAETVVRVHPSARRRKKLWHVAQWAERTMILSGRWFESSHVKQSVSLRRRYLVVATHAFSRAELAQLEAASGLHPEGRGFESLTPH